MMFKASVSTVCASSGFQIMDIQAAESMQIPNSENLQILNTPDPTQFR
jgi:hypothetical protein